MLGFRSAANPSYSTSLAAPFKMRTTPQAVCIRILFEPGFFLGPLLTANLRNLQVGIGRTG